MATINGDAGNNTLQGTSGNDIINGFAGSDYILGGAGNDYINPGTSVDGTDYIDPGTGFDTIDFSDREDGLGFAVVSLHWYDPSFSFSPDGGLSVLIDGANNFGFIFGPDIAVNFVDVSKALLNGPNGGLEIVTGNGDGDDEFRVDPGEGNWLGITGGGGNDLIIIGESGFLRLNYYGLTSGITANLGLGVVTKSYEFDAGSNYFSYTADTITGPGHVWEFQGTNYDDRIVGSRHDERFILGQGDDFVNGRGGIDLVRYDRNGITSVNVDLAKGTATGTWYGATFSDKLRNIENIRGSRNDNDWIGGDDNNNMLDGRGGNDTLLGRAGDDVLIGDAGNDKLDGGFGNDVLTGGAGFDKFIFRGNFGRDVITDFNANNGREDINLSGVAAITGFADLMRNHASQVGADVVIDAGNGNEIQLLNVLLSDLDKSDFIF